MAVGIHFALGFKDAKTVAVPDTIYLGNDKSECMAAIDKAVKSKKFGRIYRAHNFTQDMLRVSMAPIESVAIECGPDANKAHLAKLAGRPEEDKKKRDQAAADRLAEQQKTMDEHLAIHAANAKKKAEEKAAALPPKPAEEDKVSGEDRKPVRGKNVGKKKGAAPEAPAP